MLSLSLPLLSFFFCTGIQLVPQFTAQQIEKLSANNDQPQMAYSLHGTGWYSDVAFMEVYFPPNPVNRPIFEFPRIVLVLQPPPSSTSQSPGGNRSARNTSTTPRSPWP